MVVNKVTRHCSRIQMLSVGWYKLYISAANLKKGNM